MNIPNTISSARIVVSLFMIHAAWVDMRLLFIILFGVSIVSDFADGLIARKFHKETKSGAVLDTGGDVVMYLAAATGGWILWPELMNREAVLILSAILMILLSGIVSLLRHGKFPSYHTWSAKISSALVGITGFIMFAGLSSIPFRVSVIALAISVAEEILITLALPQWQPNVKSIFHAAAIRKQNVGR